MAPAQAGKARSTFEGIRGEVTGWVRPGGNHGCKAAEVVPGLWTAHYHDVDTPEKLKRTGWRAFSNACVVCGVSAYLKLRYAGGMAGRACVVCHASHTDALMCTGCVHEMRGEYQARGIYRASQAQMIRTARCVSTQ